MRTQAAVTLLCATVLSGCALGTGERPGSPEPPVAEVPAGPDPAEMRLIEAAERAERALASLALALPASNSASAMPALDSLPAALGRPVTLDWAGPLEGLARALAKRAGYRFLTAGRPPARPLIVAVEAENRPLLAVLRDAGLRAGGAATLTVDAAAESVLLDWTLMPGTVPATSPARVSGAPGDGN